MEITIKTVEGVTIMELVGRIDGRTAPEIQAELASLIVPGCRIVLDMAEVAYMSSAGLRVLATAHRQAAINDGTLVLAGLGERIQDTMSITGFLPIFTTFESVEAALAALE